jgi:hypothetical protein
MLTSGQSRRKTSLAIDPKRNSSSKISMITNSKGGELWREFFYMRSWEAYLFLVQYPWLAYGLPFVFSFSVDMV